MLPKRKKHLWLVLSKAARVATVYLENLFTFLCQCSLFSRVSEI